MYIKPIKKDRCYIFTNDEDKDGVCVILLGSVHGDEVYPSVVLENVINYMSNNNFPYKVSKLIIYPFINITAIRNRSRDSVYLAGNLNDCWEIYDIRSHLKNIIDKECEVGSPVVLIDVHSSPAIEQSICLNITDPNCDKIEDVIIYYNKRKNPKINIIKSHNDAETIKSYVNNNYYDHAFGVTLEITEVGQQILNHDRIMYDSDIIVNIIKSFSEYFYAYLEGSEEEFDRIENAINICCGNSGILEFSENAINFLPYLYPDEQIAEIKDIKNYQTIEVIKTPCPGKLVCMIKQLYVNAGDTIGLYIPKSTKTS